MVVVEVGETVADTGFGSTRIEGGRLIICVAERESPTQTGGITGTVKERCFSRHSLWEH